MSHTKVPKLLDVRKIRGNGRTGVPTCRDGDSSGANAHAPCPKQKSARKGTFVSGLAGFGRFLLGRAADPGLSALGILGTLGGRRRGLGCDGNFQFGVDLGVEAEIDREIAGFLNRALEGDAVPVDFVAGLGLEFLGDVFGRDGAERFAAVAGLEHERKLRLGKTASELLGFIEFARFALGAAGLERIRHAQRAGRDFVGHAARDEEVTGVSPADLDDIGFGA